MCTGSTSSFRLRILIVVDNISKITSQTVLTHRYRIFVLVDFFQVFKWLLQRITAAAFFVNDSLKCIISAFLGSRHWFLLLCIFFCSRKYSEPVRTRNAHKSWFWLFVFYEFFWIILFVWNLRTPHKPWQILILFLISYLIFSWAFFEGVITLRHHQSCFALRHLISFLSAIIIHHKSTWAGAVITLLCFSRTKLGISDVNCSDWVPLWSSVHVRRRNDELCIRTGS